MKNVEFDEGEAKIRLDKDFYSWEAVQRTRKAFSDFDVDVEEANGKFEVKIGGKEGVSIEKVAYQFLNYVFSEMKKQGSPRTNL